MGTKQILDLISSPTLNRGTAMYMSRSGHGITASMRRFAEDYMALSKPVLQSTAHPAKAPLLTRAEGPLSPSEMAWLSRIPSPVDPSAVSFEDARALATMEASVTSHRYPADARLIRSVWHPVRDYHDQRAAEAAIANAEQPLPSIPSSALTALAEAIAAEVPQLNYQEAVARAGRLLADASNEREAAWQQAIDAAHSQQMQVDARVLSRTSVDA